MKRRRKEKSNEHEVRTYVLFYCWMYYVEEMELYPTIMQRPINYTLTSPSHFRTLVLSRHLSLIKGEGENSEVPPHKKLKEKKKRKREKERHMSEELPPHSPGQAREARHTPSAGDEEDEGERSPCKTMKEKKEEEDGSKQKEGNEGAESHGCDGVGMSTSEQNPTETSTKQRMKESEPQGVTCKTCVLYSFTSGP